MIQRLPVAAHRS